MLMLLILLANLIGLKITIQTIAITVNFVHSYLAIFVHFYLDRNIVSFQRREAKIREMVNKAGYFVIVTSKKTNAKEALDIYRDRDAVEKIFRMEKSYLGYDVFRVHTETKLESKIFISFIALVIRNEIYKRLKPLYKKNRKEYTVPKVIRQYERMGLTKLSDNKYHQRYKLTNKQKKLIEIVGLRESDYRTFVEKIMGQLN